MIYIIFNVAKCVRLAAPPPRIPHPLQILMVVLPGETVLGETTPAGTRWQYKINSLLGFFVSGALYVVASFYLGWFSPAVFYDHWLSVITFSNIFAFSWVFVSYAKGHLWPSVGPNGKPDVNICGSIPGDMYKVCTPFPSLPFVSQYKAITYVYVTCVPGKRGCASAVCVVVNEVVGMLHTVFINSPLCLLPASAPAVAMETTGH